VAVILGYTAHSLLKYTRASLQAVIQVPCLRTKYRANYLARRLLYHQYNVLTSDFQFGLPFNNIEKAFHRFSPSMMFIFALSAWVCRKGRRVFLLPIIQRLSVMIACSWTFSSSVCCDWVRATLARSTKPIFRKNTPHSANDSRGWIKKNKKKRRGGRGLVAGFLASLNATPPLCGHCLAVSYSMCRSQSWWMRLTG
jgi:hypothetical protein